MKELPRSVSDPDLHALLALHRGELGIVAQYLRDLIKHIKKTNPCAPLSTVYALADLLDGSPNAANRIELHPNRELKAIDVRLKDMLYWGRLVAENKGAADTISAAPNPPISRARLFELGQEYKRYRTANDPDDPKPFAITKRRSRTPRKRR